MDSFLSISRKATRHTRLSLAVALLSLIAAAPYAVAAPKTNPHTNLSSDGSVALPVEAFMGNSVPASAGTGGVSARHAEIQPRTESAAEVWALWAAEAMPAPIGIETIIGADTRVRVNPTTVYPARAMVLITFSTGAGTARCSGALIGVNTVATAGHCVHRGSGGSAGFFPPSSFRIYPGRNGASSPYGVCTAKTLYTVAGWASSRSELYDYGAIKLNCSVGATTGFLGFFWQTATLTGLPSIINGYPGDKPLTQWRSTDIIRATTTQQIFYQNDTVGGMSGSPVYYNRSRCGLCMMGVHAYGLHGIAPHSTNNHGIRITQAVFNNLVTWKNAP